MKKNHKIPVCFKGLLPLIEPTEINFPGQKLPFVRQKMHFQKIKTHLPTDYLEAKQSRRRSGQRVLPGVDLINLNIKKGFVLQQSNRGLFNVSSVSHFDGEADELRLVCQV